MSVTRDILYLTHITETIDLIRSSGPDTPAALENDPDIRDATLYRLDVLRVRKPALPGGQGPPS